jgi:hypothetical protein
MARKTPVKAAPVKKSVVPRKKTASPAAVNIAGVCTSALDKLRELNLDPQLQSEIEWCLGSYTTDGNPVGLYQMAERAIHEFKTLTVTQPKAVPAKLIANLEKALKSKE